MQMKNIILSLFGLVLLVQVVSAAPGGYGSAVRLNYTINHSQFSENLVNFPYPIFLNETNFFFNLAKSDGSDLCIFDSADNQLFHEITRWYYVPGSSNAVVWVGVNISTTTDTVISLYFNTTTPCAGNNTNKTWDNDYQVVIHFNETSGQVNDATQYNRDSVTRTVITAGQTLTTIADGSDQFGLAGGNISFGDTLGISGTQSVTVEYWVYPTATSANEEFAGKPNNYDTGNYLGRMSFGWYNAGDRIYSTTSAMFANNTWNYYVMSYTSGTLGSAAIYANGTLQAGAYVTATGSATMAVTVNTLNISANKGYFTPGPIVGYMDEFRISNVTRNASWIKSTNNTLRTITGSFGTLEPSGEMFCFNINIQDEENFTAINGTIEATFEIWNSTAYNNQSAICTNVSNCYQCFSGANATTTSNGVIRYYSNATFYEGIVRYYFLVNANTSNTTLIPITLFLLNSSFGQDTQTTLRSNTGMGIADSYLMFQRFYTGTGVYRTVAMAKTNNYGTGITFLRMNDVFYRIYAYDSSGAILYGFEPQIIPCATSDPLCTFLLQGGSVDYGLTWQYYGKIAHNCTNYTQPTGEMYVACYFLDTTGLFHNFTLRTTRYTINYSSVECLNTTTGSTGVITCSLSNSTDGYYVYIFSGDINPYTDFESGYLSLGMTAAFGDIGLIITGIFIITFACIGIMMNSAPLTILGANVGLILASVIGFISISAGVLGMLLLIVLVVLFYGKRD